MIKYCNLLDGRASYSLSYSLSDHIDRILEIHDKKSCITAISKLPTNYAFFIELFFNVLFIKNEDFFTPCIEKLKSDVLNDISNFFDIKTINCEHIREYSKTKKYLKTIGDEYIIVKYKEQGELHELNLKNRKMSQLYPLAVAIVTTTKNIDVVSSYLTPFESSKIISYFNMFTKKYILRTLQGDFYFNHLSFLESIKEYYNFFGHENAGEGTIWKLRNNF